MLPALRGLEAGRAGALEGHLLRSDPGGACRGPLGRFFPRGAARTLSELQPAKGPNLPGRTMRKRHGIRRGKTPGLRARALTPRKTS